MIFNTCFFIKSYLCNDVIFTYLHSNCFIFYQKQFYCYTFDKKNLLAFPNISMNKFSLTFLVKLQSSFTYVKVFNYGSFNLSQILLVRLSDVELSPKKPSSLTLFYWNLNGIAVHDVAKLLWYSLMHCPIMLI